ncbi:MAG TPA: putative PEP-binding protein, partial [Hyphomicrobium sp.]|nr:putative PEP-binding protein [Hyphomicrobium sp.]
ESGSDGIGLFRTELMFMLSHSLPRADRQTQAYEAILNEAGDKPVVFRSLDIGGDKILPYLPHVPEENPAIGWRAIRMSLDRPALFRIQIRALLRAAAGRELRVMIPMVAVATEMDDIRVLIDKEIELAAKRGTAPPSKLLIGAMIEVPSVLFELDELLPRVNFVSVGSNDLTQFLFAADRSNSRVANRFDSLSVASLRALKQLARACGRHNVPLTLCGEMAGRPIEAMCLIGLGFRTLSMAPASIGPVKTMILSLDSEKITLLLDQLLVGRSGNLRADLERFAADHGIEI